MPQREMPTSDKEGGVWGCVIMVQGNIGVKEALVTMRDGAPCFSRIITEVKSQTQEGAGY